MQHSKSFGIRPHLNRKWYVSLRTFLLIVTLGVTLFCFIGLIETSQAQTSIRIVLVQVISPTLAIYSGPGSFYSILEQVKYGGKIWISGISMDGEWLELSYGSGQGWITNDTNSIKVISGSKSDLPVISSLGSTNVPTLASIPPSLGIEVTPYPSTNDKLRLKLTNNEAKEIASKCWSTGLTQDIINQQSILLIKYDFYGIGKLQKANATCAPEDAFSWVWWVYSTALTTSDKILDITSSRAWVNFQLGWNDVVAATPSGRTIPLQAPTDISDDYIDAANISCGISDYYSGANIGSAIRPLIDNNNWQEVGKTFAQMTDGCAVDLGFQVTWYLVTHASHKPTYPLNRDKAWLGFRIGWQAQKPFQLVNTTSTPPKR